MKRTVSRRNTKALFLSVIVLTLVAIMPVARGDEVTDARHIIDEALITIERVSEEMNSPSAMVDLMRRSKGVLVIPKYYKAGFIIGTAYGDGALLARLPEGGFGDPAFYRMTAGSIGLQAGMQTLSLIHI